MQSPSSSIDKLNSPVSKRTSSSGSLGAAGSGDDAPVAKPPDEPSVSFSQNGSQPATKPNDETIPTTPQTNSKTTDDEDTTEADGKQTIKTDGQQVESAANDAKTE